MEGNLEEGDLEGGDLTEEDDLEQEDPKIWRSVHVPDKLAGLELSRST